MSTPEAKYVIHCDRAVQIQSGQILIPGSVDGPNIFGNQLNLLLNICSRK